MISSIQLKRAKLAAELRQQHRRRIFQSKRQSNSQSTEQLFEYREQLQQRTESKKVLTTLPPYVNQLSEEEICAALELCGKVLEENIIMEQATACLVELTTLKLPTPTLNLLQTQILPRIMQLLQSTNNLQILINCVYICGNCLTTSLYQNKSVIKQVLLKVEVLCSQYPHYGNCLQLMVWYLRGVSLLYPSEDLCMYTFSMSKRIIITGLTHLQEKPSEAPSYFQLLRQCFNLLELTVTQQCINDQESMGPDSWLSDVDECVRAVLAHTSARADDIVMGSVSELLTVLVGCGRFVGSVVEFCMLATFRQVKCDSCFAVCSRMLRSELVPKQVKENLGKNMLTNLHQVLHSPEIVMKRSYRIDVMNCISTIVDELNVALSLFSAELLEGIVNVMELVWIDKDQENIANSLKLLLTLGQSLEIKGCHFRAQFFTSDRECTLIELQNHTNEQVYNMATEMIDYLGIEY